MTNQTTISKSHHACSACGSTDAATTYSDGSSFCFSCEAFTPGSEGAGTYSGVPSSLPKGEIHPLISRQIPVEICKKYGYTLVDHNGKAQQCAYYRKNSKTIAAHLRDRDKNFAWVNYQKNMELWGQHLWEAGGKELIITEGEIDCLSWATVKGGKWPVVAVPGVSSIGMIEQNIQWVSSFETVFLYFDMDEPGQRFAQEVAQLLPPGKVKIGSTPCKDSNETLVQEGQQVLYKTRFEAKTWMPEELSSAEEVMNQKQATRDFVRWHWPGLSQLTLDASAGELVLVTAGTNVGKSMVLKNMAIGQLQAGMPIGFIALEESSKSVLHNLLAMEQGIDQHAFDIIEPEQQANILSFTEWKDNITFYTDRGREYGPAVLQQVRYLAVANRCKVIFIDHLSAIFATFPDERKQIDEYIYALRQMCAELGIVIVAAAHLVDPKDGKSHNDGGVPKLSQLRGSSTLSRVPDTILGVRRNCSASDEERLMTELILLKSRFNGLRLGHSIWLRQEEGKLQEIAAYVKEEEADDYGF